MKNEKYYVSAIVAVGTKNTSFNAVVEGNAETIVNAIEAKVNELEFVKANMGESHLNQLKYNVTCLTKL